MAYNVYILQSTVDGSYYKGFTENLTQRLLDHNAGKSEYTSQKIPWNFVYIEAFAEKRLALMREKAIKKYGHERMARMISSEKNQLKDFLP